MTEIRMHLESFTVRVSSLLKQGHFNILNCFQISARKPEGPLPKTWKEKNPPNSTKRDFEVQSILWHKLIISSALNNFFGALKRSWPKSVYLNRIFQCGIRKVRHCTSTIGKLNLCRKMTKAWIFMTVQNEEWNWDSQECCITTILW